MAVKERERRERARNRNRERLARPVLRGREEEKDDKSLTDDRPVLPSSCLIKAGKYKSGLELTQSGGRNVQ